LRQELERTRERERAVTARLPALVARLAVLAGRFGRAVPIAPSPTTGPSPPATLLARRLIGPRRRSRGSRPMEGRHLALPVLHLLDDQHAFLTRLDHELAEPVEPGGPLVEVRVDLLHHLLQSIGAHDIAVPGHLGNGLCRELPRVALG